MKSFDTLDYLAVGNPLQQRVYQILTKHSIFETLSEYSPILVGTIPIDIAIENSDLDIACCWSDKQDFITTLKNSFSQYSGFKIIETDLEHTETIIASFMTEGFEVEIFGQDIPVKEQMGYRHMIIEHTILSSHGPDFRNEIIRLKENGLKTEPAFAQLLGLTGNPYQALLEYKK